MSFVWLIIMTAQWWWVFSIRIFNKNKNDLCVKFTSLIDQSNALNDLQTKKVLVNVQNMRPSKDSARDKSIEIVCKEYRNALRPESEVELRYVSPGGSSVGVKIGGTVSTCKGKCSTIALHTLKLKHQTYRQSVDNIVVRRLNEEPVSTICWKWKKLKDQVDLSLTVIQRRSERSRHERIEVFRTSGYDDLLKSIKETLDSGSSRTFKFFRIEAISGSSDSRSIVDI